MGSLNRRPNLRLRMPISAGSYERYSPPSGIGRLRTRLRVSRAGNPIEVTGELRDNLRRSPV